MINTSYHIYIHDKSGQGQSPTKPSKNKGNNTKPKSKEEIVGNTIQRVGSFIENPDNMIGAAKGAALKAAGVAGIVSVVAYNIGMKIADEAISLYTIQTGDITAQLNFNNARTILGAIFSPVSSGLSIIKTSIEFSHQNQRALFKQQLLGDSIINQNYNRKV